MRVRAEVAINAPREQVWRAVTDIDGAAGRIEAIESVEVLERPRGGDGLVGLKWRETRTMFGKQATEVMWITQATPPSMYETRAESHGSVYVSRILVTGEGGASRLAMEFEGRPVSFGAKLLWGLLGFMFKGATRKALQKDLEDIKKAVEAGR